MVPLKYHTVMCGHARLFTKQRKIFHQFLKFKQSNFTGAVAGHGTEGADRPGSA